MRKTFAVGRLLGDCTRILLLQDRVAPSSLAIRETQGTAGVSEEGIRIADPRTVH